MKSFRAGRVLGIDIFVDPSLFLLVGLLAWALFLRFSDTFPTVSSRSLLVVSVVGGLLFLASVLAHELSHSVVATRRGLTVRRIRLFIFGGVSEIEQDAEDPGQEFAIAFAGPAASIVVGVVLLLGAWPFHGAAASMVRLVALMNLLLAVFNLLPGLPLDGGRVLHALVWKRGGDKARATTVAVNVGRGLGIVVMTIGLAIVVTWGDIGGVWLLAVGWFLYQAATTSQLRERLVERASGLTMRDVMRPLTESADGDASIADVIELYGWGDRIRPMPVTVDGRVRGTVGARELGSIDESERATTPVATVMVQIGREDVVDAGEDVLGFLRRESGRGRRVLVTAGNRVVGIVTRDELSHLFE